MKDATGAKIYSGARVAIVNDREIDIGRVVHLEDADIVIVQVSQVLPIGKVLRFESFTEHVRAWNVLVLK